MSTVELTIKIRNCNGVDEVSNMLTSRCHEAAFGEADCPIGGELFDCCPFKTVAFCADIQQENWSGILREAKK